MYQARSGRELPLPPAAMRFMGEDDESLLQIGDRLAGLLVAYGMTPDSAILDVGCGYGRLALGILHSTDHRGDYLGFDILRRQIKWCRTAISPIFPTMRFVHLDIRNGRYNPKGRIDPTHASFPARSASTDVCSLFSVFTHLFRPDIERYLDEIHRVLRPGGISVTTWFLFDEARLALTTAPTASHPMVHELDGVTRYADEGDPLRAIAYEEGAIRAMAAAARLEVSVIEHGTWTGEPGRTFQDIVVLRRSETDLTVDPEPKSSGAAARVSIVARRAGHRIRTLTRRVRRRAGRLVVRH